MQKIWKFWFTKSGVWILKSLLYLQFLLHKKSVSREKFTKSREFTIFTFTKSGVDCINCQCCQNVQNKISKTNSKVKKIVDLFKKSQVYQAIHLQTQCFCGSTQ